VTNAIKGKRVEEASALLRFMPQAAARDVARVLKSATANAENNHNLSAEDLVVADAQANMGPDDQSASSRGHRVGRSPSTSP
jgi:Ribosomal protein L22